MPEQIKEVVVIGAGEPKIVWHYDSANDLIV
jgi:hypothetical protein